MSAAPTVVQSAVFNAISITFGTFHVSLPQSTGAGNTVLIFIASGNSVPTVTDNAGNTYTKVDDKDTNGFPNMVSARTFLFKATNILGGATQLNLVTTSFVYDLGFVELSPCDIDLFSFNTPSGTPAFGTIYAACSPSNHTTQSWSTWGGSRPSVTVSRTDDLIILWGDGSGVGSTRSNGSSTTSMAAGYSQLAKVEVYGEVQFLASQTPGASGTFTFDASSSAAVTCTTSPNNWDFNSATDAYIVALYSTAAVFPVAQPLIVIAQIPDPFQA